MAALTRFSTFALGATSAIVSPAYAEAWSNERTRAFEQEVLARLHMSNLPSTQVGYGEGEAVEFSSLPLVAVQTVRVKYRDVGMLPPMSFEDEVEAED